MIILYTTHCPKCRVLESKLKSKNIKFTTFTNVDEMIQLGITESPVLDYNNQRMGFVDAINFVNSL